MALIIKCKNDVETIAYGIEDKTAFEFEGHWYFDPEAVNMEHLIVTKRTYNCPYKGLCYWIDLETDSVQASNIGWVYHIPLTGYEFIKDKIAFFARDTTGTLAVRSEGDHEITLPPEQADTGDTP